MRFLPIKKGIAPAPAPAPPPVPAPARVKQEFVILVDHQVVYVGKTIRTLKQVRVDYARTVRSLMGPGGRPGLAATPYRAIYYTLARAKIDGKNIDYAFRIGGTSAEVKAAEPERARHRAGEDGT